MYNVEKQSQNTKMETEFSTKLIPWLVFQQKQAPYAGINEIIKHLNW
jgi:hypothetical protein